MDIKDIIIKSLYSTLSMKEQKAFDEWMSEGNNRKLYESIKRNLIDERDGIAFMDDIDNALAEGNKDKRIIRLNPLYGKIAACIAALLIAGATSLWYQDYTRVTPPNLSSNVIAAIEKSVEGGYAENMLDTHADQVSEDSIITPTEVTREHLEEYMLDPDKVEEMLEAQQIETRRDRESWLRLDDGTIVHMSANTRIIYPEHFAMPTLFHPNPKREVIVDGEAYFMVAHDKSRPFVVHAPNTIITDYGTEFYVSTRKNTEVALVTGKVGVSTGVSSAETILNPGEMAKTVNNGALTTSKIDVEQYKAWNTGKFSFHEQTLEKSMQVVARWYGYNVDYAEEWMKNVQVSGNFSRYDNVQTLLDAFSFATNLRFNISNRKIIIEK